MHTVSSLLLGIITFLLASGYASADVHVNHILQKHRDLRLRAVHDTPFIQTDLLLLASNDTTASPEVDEPGWTAGEESGDEGEFFDPFENDQIRPMPDPIQRVNRPFFTFNDRVYFWVLKPVSRGYGWVLPAPARRSIKRCFYNVRAPIRIVNCLLQCKGKGALTELERFLINTTIGLVGLFDPATSRFQLKTYDEDTGQTLGQRTGPGFYLSLPLLGPSSFRDGIGSIVDMLIVPTWYVIQNYGTVYTIVRVFETVNQTSLSIGEYEDLTESAIDPYVAVRNAYHQHREDLVRR